VLAVQGLVVLMLGLGEDRLGSATLGRAEAFAKECSGAAIEMVTLWRVVLRTQAILQLFVAGAHRHMVACYCSLSL
jgi:hypothetical protein